MSTRRRSSRPVRALILAALGLALVLLSFSIVLWPGARGHPPPGPVKPPVITVPQGAAAVEQTSPGSDPSADLVESFDGLGVGFTGPQGAATGRNPSDNSLAVAPDHVVQTVNSRMAIFTKKGARYDRSGQVLYGPVETNNVFKDFGGQCEARNNGDAVVRYDQLAGRWLIVMPIFRRIASGEFQGSGEPPPLGQ